MKVTGDYISIFKFRKKITIWKEELDKVNMFIINCLGERSFLGSSDNATVFLRHVQVGEN